MRERLHHFNLLLALCELRARPRGAVRERTVWPPPIVRRNAPHSPGRLGSPAASSRRRRRRSADPWRGRRRQRHCTRRRHTLDSPEIAQQSPLDAVAAATGRKPHAATPNAARRALRASVEKIQARAMRLQRARHRSTSADSRFGSPKRRTRHRNARPHTGLCAAHALLHSPRSQRRQQLKVVSRIGVTFCALRHLITIEEYKRKSNDHKKTKRNQPCVISKVRRCCRVDGAR